MIVSYSLVCCPAMYGGFQCQPVCVPIKELMGTLKGMSNGWMGGRPTLQDLRALLCFGGLVTSETGQKTFCEPTVMD